MKGSPLKEKAGKNLDAVELQFELSGKMWVFSGELETEKIIAHPKAEIFRYPVINRNSIIKQSAIQGSGFEVENLGMGLEPKIFP